MQQAVEPDCEFEELDPADLLSALRSMTWTVGSLIIHDAIGAGFDRFLSWAVDDIHAAKVADDADSRARHATNAVMSARRCLSCLVDQYLMRDGIASCRNPPKESCNKAEVLMRRGVLDALAADVLDRAIAKRNEAEHSYRLLSFEEAQDVVQIVRGTVDTLTSRSSPFNGPCLYGSFNHGHNIGPKGSNYWFNGWSDPLVVVVLFDPRPWIGVVVPSSKTRAVVRRVSIAQLSVDQLLGALSVLEQQEAQFPTANSRGICRGIAAAAGLIPQPQLARVDAEP